MRNNPHSILGVPQAATHAEIRAAFRRLALLHHPDRNLGDAAAASRFKRILRAYREIVPAEKGSAPAARVGPRPDRYACGTCGDAFPFPETCCRCGVKLHDRDLGPAPQDDRPEVEQMMARLSTLPEPSEVPEDPAKVPTVLVMGCSAAAVLVWQIGPIGPAVLFAGFAAYVAAVEAHRRATAPAPF